MHSEVEGFDWWMEENESVSFPHLNESFVTVLYPSQSIMRVKLSPGQCGKVTDLHIWKPMKPLLQSRKWAAVCAAVFAPLREGRKWRINYHARVRGHGSAAH